MARKSDTRDSGAKDSGASGADSPADALRDSAQKIWLAGLGAFERAKSEGPRMFEALVEQGRNMSVRAKDAADQALRTMREANYDASGRWDKFEQALQERVSKSLGNLGVVGSREVEALSKQVSELNEHVRNLMSAGAAGSRKASRSSASNGRKRRATAKKSATSKRKAGARTTRKASAKRGAATRSR